MLMKAQILERLVSGVNRFFKVNFFSRQTGQPVQFHSGGDDYNPPTNCEGLSGTIGENQANSVLFAWRDSAERKAAPGEKRIYATSEDGVTVKGEVYLKNDGKLNAVANEDISLTTQKNINLETAVLDVAAGQTNLGLGGQPIARLGDEITVVIAGVTYKGTITSGGANTSI